MNRRTEHHHRFTITVEAAPGNDADTTTALKNVVKRLLRPWRWRCVEVLEVDAGLNRSPAARPGAAAAGIVEDDNE